MDYTPPRTPKLNSSAQIDAPPSQSVQDIIIDLTAPSLVQELTRRQMKLLGLLLLVTILKLLEPKQMISTSASPLSREMPMSVPVPILAVVMKLTIAAQRLNFTLDWRSYPLEPPSQITCDCDQTFFHFCVVKREYIYSRASTRLHSEF